MLGEFYDVYAYTPKYLSPLLMRDEEYSASTCFGRLLTQAAFLFLSPGARGGRLSGLAPLRQAATRSLRDRVFQSFLLPARISL